MKTIPEDFQDLLQDETRAFLFLATIMKDGHPQVTPVWFNAMNDLILINSAKGRVKDLNIRRFPLVAMCIQDPSNPYRYLQIQGRVIEISEQDTVDHIDKLTQKYTGKDKYPYGTPGEIHVCYKIQIQKVDAHG